MKKIITSVLLIISVMVMIIGATNVNAAQENVQNTDSAVVSQEDKINTTKTVDKATLYVLPLLNSTKIDNLNKDEDVRLISVNGDWAYVKTKNSYGWIFGSKLLSTTITMLGDTQIDENVTLNSVNTVENNVANSVNSVNNVINNTVSNEVSNTVNNTENDTVNNTVNENESNVVSSNDADNTYPTIMYVNVDAVNIRAKADATSDLVASVGKGCEITVRGKEGDWYKVETSDGKGYIKAEFLSKNK